MGFKLDVAQGHVHGGTSSCRLVPKFSHTSSFRQSAEYKFKSIFRQLQRGKALEAMTFLDGYYLLALDGTGYFSSKTIHCASCLHQVHRNGTITYTHQMLGAAIIHPDVRAIECQ